MMARMISLHDLKRCARWAGLGVTFVLASVVSGAEAPTTARSAADHVQMRFGVAALAALGGVEGTRGTPQPVRWTFMVADPRSKNGMKQYVANANGAADRGAVENGYPDAIPLAYFNWSQVKVDSDAAFQAADKEARAAKVGFDSVNFLLRAREGSLGPVWTMMLIDTSKRLVGRVEISAASGEVTRRIWLHYKEGPGKVLTRVEDSATPALPLANPTSPTPASPPVPPPLEPTTPTTPTTPPAPPAGPGSNTTNTPEIAPPSGPPRP